MVDVKDLFHQASHYQFAHDEISLGALSSYSMTYDPKHLVFVLSRYKFCAKMLQGKKTVMEVGCGDGIGLPLIAKGADKVYCLDWEQRLLDSIQRRLSKYYNNIALMRCDPTEEEIEIKADAAFSIDFLEHVDPAKEAFLMENIVRCLPKNGVLITGTPNISAAQYASSCSSIQHINLKSQETLKELMERYFDNVFMFGMNDEVLHTGFGPMCHYIWSVAAGVKEKI